MKSLSYSEFLSSVRREYFNLLGVKMQLSKLLTITTKNEELIKSMRKKLGRHSEEEKEFYARSFYVIYLQGFLSKRNDKNSFDIINAILNEQPNIIKNDLEISIEDWIDLYNLKNPNFKPSDLLYVYR